MAIVQISRITQRKGLLEDLPQPLAGAELGWAIDERRLFIGNGALADGAPVVGNTEILTEFSDILNFATAYTYEGAAAGYVVQTGPTVSNPVSQSIQSRLDSYAIVTDFGAKGDGVTDDTAAINRALYELYCREVNPQIRRSLFFPAGVYVVTNTINIPPYCMLYGEGNLSSIISFDVEAHTATIPYAAGVLVTEGAFFYRSIAEVPIGVAVTNVDYWEVTSLPQYIGRTADSLQQTGANIATNGATAPRDIHIANMAFATNQIQDGFLIEDATQNFTLSDVNFVGPLTGPTDNLDDIAAIRFASTASLVCTQINIDRCAMYGWNYAINTEQQVKGATISNCQFYDLYQGIILGGASPVDGGPTGVNIMHNTFDQIYHEGVVIDGVKLNATGFNSFFSVGNEYNSTPLSSGTSTAVIDINIDSNISVGDMFSRTAAQAAATNPRIALNYTTSIAFEGGDALRLGNYTRTSATSATLLNNSSGNLITIPATTTPAFKMDYTIKRGTLYRTGTITVVADAEDSAGDFSFIDDYVENNNLDVTLNAVDTSVTGGNLVIQWSTDNTGVDATIYYSITNLYSV